ncbi:MAG: hypothetical protein AB1750_12295, partial [Chloroflexota bacterium]
WLIDQYYQKRSGINADAVANVIREAEGQAESISSSITSEGSILRIGVWHHPVSGGESAMTDTDFIENLRKNGVRIGIHGDVHELRRDVMGYWRSDSIYIIGGGSFGSLNEGLPAATPRLYNVIEINRDLHKIRVHTRYQEKFNGSWEGWNRWDRLDGQGGGLPYYDVDLYKHL